MRWEGCPVTAMASPAHTLNIMDHSGAAPSLPPAPRMEQDCPGLLPQLLQQLKMFVQVGRRRRSPRQLCAPCHMENCPADPARALVFWALVMLTRLWTKDTSAILNIASADGCLYPNWALGSTVTLRKQWEAHQQSNWVSLLQPETTMLSE